VGSDAISKVPTVEEEIAKFKSYAVKDGEPADGAQTPEETAALAQQVEVDEAAKQAAKSGAPKAKEPAASDTSTEEEPAKEAATEGEGEPAAVVTEPPKKKAKQTAEERIAELTRQRHETERRAAAQADADRARIVALEARLTPAKEAATETTEQRPTPDKYEYGELDVKFISDLARYEARQEFKAAQAAENKTRQSEAARQEAAKLTERKAAFFDAGAAKFDDFQEVVANSEYISDIVGELALGSEVGPEVIHHLASDPKLARQVFGLSPVKQAAYFGRLEAQFSAPSAAKSETPARTTKAPPPVRTAKGAGGKPQVTADTSDFSAFEAMAMGSGR